MTNPVDEFLGEVMVGFEIVARKVIEGAVQLYERYDVENRADEYSGKNKASKFSGENKIDKKFDESTNCQKFHMNDFELCAEKVGPSIVKIIIYEQDELMGEIESSTGSGFIIFKTDTSSFILTNAHIITIGYSKIIVQSHNNEKLDAMLIHMNDSIDLALIKIDKTNLPVLKLSNDIKVGKYVAGFGYPNRLTKSIMTQGIISSIDSKGKELGLRDNEMSYILFTSQINLGNSGGPLVSIEGKVIGVITYKTKSGLNLAIPSHKAMEFLRNFSPFNISPNIPKRRNWGMEMSFVNKNDLQEYKKNSNFDENCGIENGIILHKIYPGMLADKIGFKINDLIVEINSEKVSSISDLLKTMGESNFTIHIIRNFKKLKFSFYEKD